MPGEANPATPPPKAARPDVQTSVPDEPVKAREGPRIVKVRAELRFDESINRVVGRMINEETGEEVREIPPAELRRIYAAIREMLGSQLDETA
ncbi:MAG: flagellar protein FlaG [Kiloniellaceae bacterium]